MDTIGVPEIQWVRGYSGGPAKYIDKETIAYVCGNNVNFMKEGGTSVIFSSPGEGVNSLDVHPLNKMFAFAELCLNPKIFVYKYPDMELVSQLKGGAELEYTHVCFSSSDYLVSLAGIPEYKLTLWNYQSGELLMNVELPHLPVSSLSINPGNWRQICVTTAESLIVFTTEQSDIKFNAQGRNQELFVGTITDTASKDDGAHHSDTYAITRLEYDLTPSSIAGLFEPEASRFESYRDPRTKCIPVSHTWTPVGDVVIGCEHGQLLKLDGESWQLKVLFSPAEQRQPSRSLNRSMSLLSHDMSILEEETNAETESSATINYGSLHCMTLHKKGLYVGGKDGVIRCVDLTNDNVKLVDSCSIGVPITSLDFSTNWSHLNIGSDTGCMYTYDVNAPGSVKEFINEHSGNFVSVQSVAPGYDNVVTVRENGYLQVWALETGLQLGTISLGLDITAMVSSPLATFTILGTSSGYLFVVDITDFSKPRLVHRCRAFNEPITRMAFSQDGGLCLMGCASGVIVIMSGLASDEFKMLGFIKVQGAVENITTVRYATNVQVVVSSNTTGHLAHGANKCTTFTLADQLVETIESHYASLKADLKEEAVNLMIFNYASPSYGACLVAEDSLFSLAQDNKKLQRLVVPKEKPKKPNSKDSFLLPEVEFAAHQLPGGKLILSPHSKWLGSVGADGKLQIRTLAVSDQERFVEAHPHDYRHGGVKTAAWSTDSQWILTSGRSDGILCCYKLKFTATGESNRRSALMSARQQEAKLSEAVMKERDALKALQEWNPEPVRAVSQSAGRNTSIADAVADDEIYATPTPVPKSDTTWLEARELLAHTEEDKKYSEVKRDLRYEIREIRRTLQGLMENNKNVPDIEKLQHYDFDLDVDEQIRLQELGDAEVKRIREQMEMENLAKQYLTYLIKKECWDSMEVKGRSIQGFSIPLEVQNYPMKQRIQEELSELSRVIAIRHIELAEIKARGELVEVMLPKTSSQQVTGEEGEEEEAEVENPSITGSMGALYGGKSELFYNQFELYNREQKVNQIVLLKDAIHRIKMTFNKEFEEVHNKKEAELVKISEKTKRIAKIFQDLNIKETVKYHSLTTKEKPELLLTVADSEVKVEKYLTPEQQKAKEEAEKAEEERRRKERGDNARERALDQMMGGVLEIKKEDELKKDVPIPPFIQAKEHADWTEEEHKIAKEYERKCKELEEEREKYAKQLEAEMKKLQGLIVDAEQAFNDQLKALFTKKLKVEMVIGQEELKIVRLQWGLMFQQALETKERQLEAKIEHTKHLKQLAAEAYIIARKNVDNFKEGYDILVAEDKVMDKGFKREFSDLTALQLDLMYKLFRKRPRGTKALHNRGETPILDPNSGNPFSERPSTARSNYMQKQALELALSDLDKFGNAPEGVELSTWERLTRYRRAKIESEQLVKQKALIMAEMISFQQKRQDEDFKIAEQIEDLSQELSRLKETMMRHHLNLQVQLLMKQGQVELHAGEFILDYSDSVLVHRSVVEDLNGKIKALGESKISSMVESKDFRKGIIQLEWEHKKNLMKIEDLRNKMRTISMMKVTREIQSYLSEEDHDAKVGQEVNLLEQTILLQKKHHEANVEVKRKQLSELKRTVKDREFENKVLLAEIEELNVTVNERQHIFESSADKNIDAVREKRYQEIVQRRKLVDLAKAQANEVAVLRAEVERLRMRTFPALVQVER